MGFTAKQKVFTCDETTKSAQDDLWQLAKVNSIRLLDEVRFHRGGYRVDDDYLELALSREIPRRSDGKIKDPSEAAEGHREGGAISGLHGESCWIDRDVEGSLTWGAQIVRG